MIKVICKNANSTELVEWILNSINWMCLFGDDEVDSDEEYELAEEALAYIRENHFFTIETTQDEVNVKAANDLSVSQIIDKIAQFAGELFEYHRDAPRTMATVARSVLEQYPDAEFISDCLLGQEGTTVMEAVKTKDGVIYRKKGDEVWEEWAPESFDE